MRSVKKNKSETDTAVNHWLLNNTWVHKAPLSASDTMLIQNVVNDSVALVIDIEYIEKKDLWLVSYYHGGVTVTQFAAEMWSWRVLEDKLKSV
mgnify:CR=1 FL=1|jgi:hypothetical protein|tara:strand:- start:13899 stop:14177 length:279 start_codon:yes stop_codon:yes gene_type:complete